MTDAYQQPPAAPVPDKRVPDKPALDGLEAVWSVRWEADQVYRFDRSRPRDAVYAIDTPPPTLGQHNEEIFGELAYNQPAGHLDGNAQSAGHSAGQVAAAIFHFLATLNNDGF